jgi:KDO2-lipid IV(A) lauroyltransferase
MIRLLNYLAYLALRIAWFMGKFLPMKPTFACAWLLGNLAYYILPGRRRIALKNLEIAFGKEKSEAERKRICRRSFVNLVYSGTEFLFMERIAKDWKNRFIFEGDQMIDDCIRRKQAFFVFGGHLGGWMMIAMVPQRFGVSGGVVIRPQRNPYIDAFIRRLVAKAKGVMINTRGTGKQIEKMIMDGWLIGFYMDQESRRKMGIPVDFFGMPAYSHVVPGYLAWKHKIPMFPFWMPRIKPGYFKAIYRPSIEFTYSGDKEKDIRDVTQRIVKEVENTIREYPEQWLWAHNRWSRTLRGEEERKEQKKKRKKMIEDGVYLTSKQVLKMMDEEIGEAKDERKAGSP